MLENHPILRERVLAATAFCAIGVGGVLAVDTIVTGGFDFPPPLAAPSQTPRIAYPNVANSNWIPASYNSDFHAPERIQPNVEMPSVTLEGDAVTATVVEARFAPSEDELYAEIDALYHAEDAFTEDYPAEEITHDKEISAYETASPW